MWFITEFLERTSRSFARTVMKVAAQEAEAQRRALAEARCRRVLASGLILPERSLCVPSVLVLEPRIRLADAPEPQRALAHLVEAQEAADAATAAIEAVQPGDVLAAIAEAGVPAVEEVVAAAEGPALPLGVRGDVVGRYVAALEIAPAGERAVLIEKLRKDKKVRVAELQLIAAALIGGEVVHRKKADHLDAIRRHIVPVERRRAAPAEIALHVG